MTEILKALAKDLGVFSEAEKAAKDRDTSLVHWRFLGDVLRHLPRSPLHNVVAPVIRGMDLMAAGKEWPEAEDAYSAANAEVGECYDDERPVESAATWAALAVEWKAWDNGRKVCAVKAARLAAVASTWCGPERERQREALLRLIGECPSKGENQ